MKTKNRIWLYPLIVIGLILILTNSCKKSDDNKNPSTSVSDKDGNSYTSVTIGTQVWMVENLKTTKYNDGTAIPNVTDNYAWQGLSTGAYSWYNNDITYKTPYGAMYNWYAVNTGKLCPTGWHVPTDAEWTTLITFLGGEDVAGGKLKEQGTTHWQSPNTGATNESGFTWLPGGLRDNYGNIYSLGIVGDYWGSTEGSFYRQAWTCGIWNDKSTISTNYRGAEGDGQSVRCIKN